MNRKDENRNFSQCNFFHKNRKDDNRRLSPPAFFTKNRKGDIPITILTIGTIAICIYALISFSLTNTETRDSFVGLGKMEELNSQMEENYFNGNMVKTGKVSEEIIAEGDLINAINYAKKNEAIKRFCNCGDYCEEYAEYILKYSAENGIPDALLFLSLMMQESECESGRSSGSSVGLMQINLANCKQYNKYGFFSEDDCEVQLLENAEMNIKVGAKILKEYYNQYNGGICKEDKDCKHPRGDVKNCDGEICKAKCNIEKVCEYEFDGCSKRDKFYTGWEAALRGYNGWGCDSALSAQDNFVEEIMQRYKMLKGESVKGTSFSVEYLGSP